MSKSRIVTAPAKKGKRGETQVVRISTGELLSVLPRLTRSVEVLATHRGEAKRRVQAAFDEICMLRRGDFPKKYQQDFDLILGSPPGNGNSYSRDWWEKRFYCMHQKTAVQIAKGLFRLYIEVQHELWRAASATRDAP